MKCDKCGTEFDGEFCPKCEGKREITVFVEDGVLEIEMTPEHKVDYKEVVKKWWFWAIVAAVVILTVVLVWNTGNEDDKSTEPKITQSGEDNNILNNKDSKAEEVTLKFDNDKHTEKEDETEKVTESNDLSEGKKPQDAQKVAETMKAVHIHSYSAATCTEPGKCSCGAISGSALGHSYDKGKCSQCDATDPNYFEPLVFSGSGDKIITGVTLAKGLYKVSLTNRGPRNFIVVAYDGNGDRKSNWSNEIGDYKGQGMFNRGKNGMRYCIEVVSEGTWSINFGLDETVTSVTTN